MQNRARHRRFGQSLSEYALVGALVVIFAIASLFYLTDTLEALLPDLADQVFGLNYTPQQVAQQPSGSPGASSPGLPPTPSTTGNTPSPPPSSSGSQANGFGAVPPPGAGQEQVCFPSGACFNVPVIAGGPLETVGGLGGEQVSLISSVLTQLADQLDLTGADAELVGLVRNLANSGHDIGNHMDLMEATCPINVSNSCTGSKLTKLDNTLKVADPNLYNSFTDARYALDSYLSAHPNALADFPEATSIIDFEADQIENYTAGISMAGDIPIAMDGSTDPVNGHTNVFINHATEVHQSANTICATGKGGSSCTYRTP